MGLYKGGTVHGTPEEKLMAKMEVLDGMAKEYKMKLRAAQAENEALKEHLEEAERRADGRKPCRDECLAGLPGKLHEDRERRKKEAFLAGAAGMLACAGAMALAGRIRRARHAGQ